MEEMGASPPGADFGLGSIPASQGKLGAAIPVFEHGLRLCERNDIGSCWTAMAWNPGHAYSPEGDPTPAAGEVLQCHSAAAGMRLPGPLHATREIGPCLSKVNHRRCAEGIDFGQAVCANG